MVTRQDFLLDLVQASIFMPGDRPGPASSKIVQHVLAEFGGIFDGELQVLPIPSDAPPEIPRVVLQSADGKWRLSAAFSRIDFVVSQAAQASAGQVLQASEKLAEFIASTRRLWNADGKRLAFIVNRSCKALDPAQVLIAQFCNETAASGPFDRSATFEIHNHKQYIPTGLDYRVNSWVRCRCGKMESEPVVVVTQDLNTPEPSIMAFDDTRIKQFFSCAPNAVEEILGKYFPE